MTHALYRFFDADDQLLYVGLSVNPGRRFEKHRALKEWWNDVARIDIEHYSDLPTLRAAEREAIKEEKPLYNIRMNERPVRADDLIWRCQVCTKPIADGEGFVGISYSELSAFDKSELEWKARNEQRRKTSGLLVLDAAEFIKGPLPVSWRIRHDVCDQPEGALVDGAEFVFADYGIAIERIRTAQQLLGWTAHLLESKGWLANTNWDEILRGYGTDS